MIKVALAQDQLLFRNGIRMIIDRMTDIELVHEADNVQKLFKLMNKEGPPDVALVDLKMPYAIDVELLEGIRKKYPDLKVLVFMMQTNYTLINIIKELGGSGYLLRDTNAKQLETAINKVYRAGFYFP